MEHYFTGSSLPFPKGRFPDVRTLAESALKNLSIRNLSSAAEFKLGPGGGRPVEDAYKVEFYRVLNTLLGFSSRVSCEWSGSEKGRIDLWFPDVKWGIELLREGDKLGEHCRRFVGNGKYTQWIRDGLLEDWIIIDCRIKRTSLPRPYSKFTICWLRLSLLIQGRCARYKALESSLREQFQFS